MNGTVAPESRSSTAAATCAGRTPSSAVRSRNTRAGSTSWVVGIGLVVFMAVLKYQIQAAHFATGSMAAPVSCRIIAGLSMRSDPTMIPDDLSEMFSAEGPLAKALPAYVPREAQL